MFLYKHVPFIFNSSVFHTHWSQDENIMQSMQLFDNVI